MAVAHSLHDPEMDKGALRGSFKAEARLSVGFRR